MSLCKIVFILVSANENHWRSWDIRCCVSLAGQAKSKEDLEHTQVAANRLQSVAKNRLAD